MRILLFTVLAFLSSLPAVLGATNTNLFAEVESHLQARAWDEALVAYRAMDAADIPEQHQAYGAYLELVALRHQEDFNSAVERARAFETAHAKSHCYARHATYKRRLWWN